MEGKGTDGLQLYVAITAKTIQPPPSGRDRHPDLWSREVPWTFSPSQIPDVLGAPRSARQHSDVVPGICMGSTPDSLSAFFFSFFFPGDPQTSNFFHTRDVRMSTMYDEHSPHSDGKLDPAKDVGGEPGTQHLHGGIAPPWSM